MKSFHLGQSVSGALDNWNPRNWRDCVTDTETGKTMTPKQVKKKFEEYQAKGIEMIPFGECPTFDYKTGCPGHEIES